ncbi:hypothetical protein IMZ31_21535 (plasmid) [Pontibacillus sp. ALD_SL1]|uniref:hypothetical protein n=1 Tax=Pontibacillus sp. ALD_SL1 TaxID=2777185 RepID=UPI001A96A6C1|nr:hypothetical protein [Pontibacillus sp. ALD_SL1]QST02035.1 hypothetical protein IMZ31_21535 [Pontibacillus sp. ALD_SL1]
MEEQARGLLGMMKHVYTLDQDMEVRLEELFPKAAGEFELFRSVYEELWMGALDLIGVRREEYGYCANSTNGEDFTGCLEQQIEDIKLDFMEEGLKRSYVLKEVKNTHLNALGRIIPLDKVEIAEVFLKINQCILHIDKAITDLFGGEARFISGEHKRDLVNGFYKCLGLSERFIRRDQTILDQIFIDMALETLSAEDGVAEIEAGYQIWLERNKKND